MNFFAKFEKKKASMRLCGKISKKIKFSFGWKGYHQSIPNLNLKSRTKVDNNKKEIIIDAEENEHNFTFILLHGLGNA